MRILFLHHAFPGPLRYLVGHMASLPDTSVFFASEYNRRDVTLPGVQRIILDRPKEGGAPPGRNGGRKIDAAQRDMQQAMRRGAAAAKTLVHLRDAGFAPDIVFASVAMGGSFFLRDIFPEAFIAMYAEWYYTPELSSVFESRVADDDIGFAKERVRNLLHANALLECDLAFTSTFWQKRQFPARLAEAIHVLPRGVDTAFFSPGERTAFVTEGCDLSHVEELVTFSGRGTDPFRGFPHLIKSLPGLLRERPACHVLLMVSGLEQEQLPALRAELFSRTGLDPERVHILGFSPLKTYRMLLRASCLHVYLTAPFALSSGLFEAMSCGCLLLGADTEPVREVVRHGENGFLCDMRQAAALGSAMATLLERKRELDHVRAAARRAMLETYDQNALAEQQAAFLLDRYAAWQGGGRAPRSAQAN